MHSDEWNILCEMARGREERKVEDEAMTMKANNVQTPWLLLLTIATFPDCDSDDPGLGPMAVRKAARPKWKDNDEDDDVNDDCNGDDGLENDGEDKEKGMGSCSCCC